MLVSLTSLLDWLTGQALASGGSDGSEGLCKPWHRRHGFDESLSDKIINSAKRISLKRFCGMPIAKTAKKPVMLCLWLGVVNLGKFRCSARILAVSCTHPIGSRWGLVALPVFKTDVSRRGSGRFDSCLFRHILVWLLLSGVFLKH